MTKSLHSPEYRLVRKAVADLRNEAGLSQRELAAKLKVQPSWVAKVELGERRLDLVELIWVCNALEVDPLESVGKIVRQLTRQKGKRSKA